MSATTRTSSASQTGQIRIPALKVFTDAVPIPILRILLVLIPASTLAYAQSLILIERGSSCTVT